MPGLRAGTRNCPTMTTELRQVPGPVAGPPCSARRSASSLLRWLPLTRWNSLELLDGRCLDLDRLRFGHASDGRVQFYLVRIFSALVTQQFHQFGLFQDPLFAVLIPQERSPWDELGGREWLARLRGDVDVPEM